MFILASPGSVWHNREAHTVRPGAGGEVRQICEGENRDWAKLCQTTEVGFSLLYLFPYMSSPEPFAACASLVAHKNIVCERFLGLMTALGQILACLWNTSLILQLQRARCLSTSPVFLTHLVPSAQAHICCSAELCCRAEEVGADWHMTDWKWSLKEWKKEEQLNKYVCCECLF